MSSIEIALSVGISLFFLIIIGMGVWVYFLSRTVKSIAKIRRQNRIVLTESIRRIDFLCIGLKEERNFLHTKLEELGGPLSEKDQN